MRAACRLSQLQTAAKIRTITHRLGTLTGLPLRAATAKQLRSGTGRVNHAAATPICREESLHAALGQNVTHVIEYAEGPSNSTASAAKRRKLSQHQPGPANRVLDGTGTSITRGINSSTSNVSNSGVINSIDSSSSSGRVAHASTTVISRSRQLDALESFLGYTFRDISLLEQACTHDLTGDQPSYRELAFVGDAALWLLFAEHAFKAYGSLEDPISGAWPAHLSRLLSRANCAATARQWGLDAYLQHSTPQHSTLQHSMPQHETGRADSWSLQQPPGFAGDTQQTSAELAQMWIESQNACSSSSRWLDNESLVRTSSTSSTSSSSSSSSSSLRSSTSHRRSGTYAGAWTSDTLAEMFEGVVGALLLDCGYEYETLKQLLLPWVASSLEASQQAGAATGLSTAAVVQPAAAAADTNTAMHIAYQHSNPGTMPALQQLQQSQQLQAALLLQLQETCGFQFSSHHPLKSASQHMMQVMTSGTCSAEAETLKFLGFGILQFTAALQAYHLQHRKGRESSTADRLWPAQLQEGWWCADSSDGSTTPAAEGSDSSSWSSSSSSTNSGHTSNVVQHMSEHAGELTTVRHRAKMWLLLLEGTPWCPFDSYLTNSNWKKQKQALARCLDLLLAAVYLDSGLEAAVGVAALLIHTTPPTTHDKSWMPAWARQNSRPVAAVR